MKNSRQNNFWHHFAKKSWERNPVLVKNFNSSITEINQNEIFKMLVEYSKHCRKVRSSDGFKLFVNGQMMHPTEVLQFLPLKSDGTLSGYHKRMEKYFPDYCLICDELLQTSREHWNKLHDFASALFSHVGFPNRFVEMGLYLGNYRKTPFGVHVDGCGVFSFPVVGTKTFRLWKPSFAKNNPSLDRALSYSQFKKNSTTMKASQGDMTYWPSSAWHIAESDGSFSATWSLGVWLDQTHLDHVELAMRPLLKNLLGIVGSETVTKNSTLKSNGELPSLPENYLQSIQKIKCLSKDELNDAFMHNWLKLMSMHGFKTTHRRLYPSKLSLTSRVQFSKSEKILWAYLKSKKKIIYAFESKLIETPPSANLHKFVEALNSGQQCKISEYLRGDKKSQELRLIRTLLI